jgi:hypothetical protein
MIRAFSGAAALGAAGIPDHGAGASGTLPRQGPRVEHFSTSPGAELVSAIEVRPSFYRYATLYSLKVPVLRKGDVVQAHAQFEVTNNLGFNVMLGHAMLLHPEETIVVHGDMPGARILCEYAGENLTPDMHHGFRTLMGSFAATDDGDVWISVLIYAISSVAKPADRLTVEKAYGGLRVIVFRQGV